MPGVVELLEAIGEKLRSRMTCTTSRAVLVSTGAKQSLMNLCLALLGGRRRALFLAPFWVSYIEMARFAGATPVVASAGIEQDYKVTAKQLEAAITSRTRLIFLNSPSNPTGSMYTRDELQVIANVVLAHDDLYVVRR